MATRISSSGRTSSALMPPKLTVHFGDDAQPVDTVLSVKGDHNEALMPPASAC